MKKWISIFTIAIMAACGVSCQLNGGTDPNPERANNLLWGRAHDAITHQYQIVMAIEQLNDTIRDVTYNRDVYGPCHVSSDEGTYNIDYEYNNKHYRIETFGKSLDEGGKWRVYIKNNPYAEFVWIGTVQGVVGEPAKFSFNYDSGSYHSTKYRDIILSEIEYHYDPETKIITTKFNRIDGYSADKSSELVAADYLIEFEAREPVVFHNAPSNSGRLHSGKVEILYGDTILDYQRELTVTIDNNRIIYQ